MSGRYLYCQNPECGEYLGSLGGDSCRHCGWCAGEAPEDDTDDDGAAAPKEQDHA